MKPEKRKSHLMVSIMLILLLAPAILMLQGGSGSADSDHRTVMPVVTGKILYAQPAGQNAAVSYPSIIRLQHQKDPKNNGILLATFSSDREPPLVRGNMVFRSDDDGYTWTGPISHVRDPKRLNMILWEPRLYELPQKCGDLEAGTILYAARSFGHHGTWNFGCDIQIHYSTDQGRTWKFLSTVTFPDQAFGSYEPHLIVAADGGLVCYWSDETTAGEGNDGQLDQIIVHKVSYDGGKTWGPMVEDVVIPDKRPGMPTVVRIPDGRYVMCYEVVRDRASLIRIKVSPDGLNWDKNDPGTPVETALGEYAGAVPTMTWIPGDGGQGQLVISAGFLRNSKRTDRVLFVLDVEDLDDNRGYRKWRLVKAPVQYQGGENDQAVGYVQPMIPTADGRGIIHLSTSYVSTEQNYILCGRSPDYDHDNYPKGFGLNRLEGLEGL